MKKNEILNNKELNNVSKETANKITIKKVINIIEYFIICVVVFCNSFLIGRSLKNPNKTPDLFGEKAFVIISGSMIPTIQIGDVAIVRDNTNVQVGDIIAFRKNATVIVHRVINEMNVDGKTMYQTKGDNNDIADLELVKTEEIEGIFQGKIPYIGKVLMFLYNNLAIVVIIVVVILLIKYLLSLA